MYPKLSILWELIFIVFQLQMIIKIIKVIKYVSDRLNGQVSGLSKSSILAIGIAINNQNYTENPDLFILVYNDDVIHVYFFW